MDIKAYLSIIDKVIEQGTYKDNWDSLKEHPIPAWYKEGRFGLFIHWGVYSVPSFCCEWYSRLMYEKGHVCNLHHKMKYGGVEKFGYKDFIPMFKAEKFDADEWLNLFRKSGAKYIMPVGEHHDGFKMYESELNRWNSVEMGPKRDILKELHDSADRHGLGFLTSSHRAEHYWFMNGGRNYPNSDVCDEKYRDFYGPAFAFKGGDSRKIQPTEEWLEDWLASTAEMIDRNRPLAIYFDFWVRQAAFRPYMKKFLAYYYNRAKEWGKEVTVFYKWDAIMYGAAIFDIERGQASGILPRMWQNDTAIAKNSWGYTEGNRFKSTQEIIWNLADVVSKNGCLMLNVGPKPNGEIAEEEREVLLGVGAWLEKNGEAIYGSEPYRFYGEGKKRGGASFAENTKYNAKDFRFTYKNGAIYVIAMKPSASGKFVVKSLSQSNDRMSYIVKSVTHLETGEEVRFEHDKKALTLYREGVNPDLPAVFKIVID